MGASVLLLALVATTSGHTSADAWRSVSLPAAGAASDPGRPHQHSQDVSGGIVVDLGRSDDLVRPGDLVIDGDLVDLRDLMGPGDATNLVNNNNSEPVRPGDVISTGDLVRPRDLVRANHLTTTGDLGSPGDPVSPIYLVRTGDLDKMREMSAGVLMIPGRSKRKVISRGGHYIVWSRSGTSPWSSTSYETVSDYRINNNREYGWNSRGNIGDGGSRKFYKQPEDKKEDRRASRKKLNKSFKREIAQYAMVYGTQKAAVHYEKTIGRRLRDRVVQKFVQRYQERRKRKRRRRRRRGHS